MANPREGLTAEDPPQHIYRWFEAAQHRMIVDLDEAVSDSIKQIGFRRLRALQMISTGGTRQQELAERLRVTKQAIADFVNALETDGLVTREPDPSDRRAWLVVRTADGERLNDELNAAIDSVELELARTLGADRYRAVYDALRVLGGRPA